MKNDAKAAGKPVPKILLLEHDNRFAVFKDEFVFYDFAQPIRLPGLLPPSDLCQPLSSPPPLISKNPKSVYLHPPSQPKRLRHPRHLRPTVPIRGLPDQSRADGEVAVQAGR